MPVRHIRETLRMSPVAIRSTLTVVALLLWAETLPAQENLPLPDSLLRNEIRLSLSRGFYDQSSSILLPGDSSSTGSCGMFRDGSGGGYQISVGFDHDLASAIGISLVAELFTWDISGGFPCVEEADIRMPDGSLREAETEFVRESTGLGLSIGLGSYYRFGDIRLGAGLAFSQVLSSGQDYREEVVRPSGVVFTDGRSERLIDGVDEPEQLQVVDGFLNMEYRLPAGYRLWLVPQAGLRIPVVSRGSEAGSMTRFLIGLGVCYRFDLLGRDRSSPLDPGVN